MTSPGARWPGTTRAEVAHSLAAARWTLGPSIIQPAPAAFLRACGAQKAGRGYAQSFSTTVVRLSVCPKRAQAAAFRLVVGAGIAPRVGGYAGR
jgi:hypothetical protein